MNKIGIFYSNRMFADGLESIIQELDDYEVIGSVHLKNGIFDYLKNVEDIDILLIELNCPKISDVSLISSLTSEYPLIRKFIISVMPKNNLAKKILESGVDAFLLKSCNSQDIFTALSKIKENSVYYCSDITKNMVVQNGGPDTNDEMLLTSREKEILSMLVNCMTNGEIADKLDLSENTIKTHRRNMQSKFGSNNIIGMIRYACRNSLIDFGGTKFCLDCPHCAEY